MISLQAAFYYFKAACTLLAFQFLKRICHCRISRLFFSLRFAVSRFVVAFFGLGYAFCRLLFLFQTHGQRNPFTRCVHFNHFHFHHIASLHHITRVSHKFIGQHRNMHQTVLMYANIHKRAKIRYVGHHTFQNHANF